MKRGDDGWSQARRDSSRMISYVCEISGVEWKSLRESMTYICEVCGVSKDGRKRSDIAVECLEKLTAKGFVIPFSYITPWERRGKQPVFVDPRRANATTRAAFYASWEWKRLRYDILKERGRICECCHANGAEPGVKIHVDHIKPVRNYWELRLKKSNLEVLCEDCNMGKGSRDETDWRPKNGVATNAAPSAS